MRILLSFVTDPEPCGYLPDRDWQLRYDVVDGATPADYFGRMHDGWRRFGHAVFRPDCDGCTECQSIRIVVDEFAPNRSQRRCRKRNDGDLELVIGDPMVTHEKLRLYDRYHAFQSDAKGWPGHAPKDPKSYIESFVMNPFPTEEWCYYLGEKLVGVGYVDRLPLGTSAIYFYYDPDIRDRSPGTYNVLRVIERTRQLGLPHAYLGYYVEGCRSLAYKANFGPSEVRTPEGEWVPFVPPG